MMVILVWLGLTSRRGTAAVFAPVTIAASAYLAWGIAGSRIGFADAVLVIVVSTGVAETIAWAMCELRSREQLLAIQATTDSLTGLLNRAAFTERLEDSCARGERLMLAFVDLNGFRDVNDTFGHHVGDEVLVEMGRRLCRVARNGRHAPTRAIGRLLAWSGLPLRAAGTSCRGDQAVANAGRRQVTMIKAPWSGACS